MAQNAKTQKAQLKRGKAATLKKLFFDPQKICLLVAFEDHHLCQLAPCNLAHGLLFHHPRFHRSLHALHALQITFLLWAEPKCCTPYSSVAKGYRNLTKNSRKESNYMHTSSDWDCPQLMGIHSKNSRITNVHREKVLNKNSRKKSIRRENLNKK